jgi:glycosyltransferase involved in cell wall biosynthesis
VASGDLVANLESPLPVWLPTDCASAVFCCGACFHRDEAVTGIELLVDGVPCRAAAIGMPRPDLAVSGPRAFRSGFWGTVQIPPRDRPGSIELALAARSEGGHEFTVPLGRIPVVAREAAAASQPEEGLIAVCMATYDPDPELFATQIESLRAQTDTHWVCVISDDCSSPERFARLEEIIGGDGRFTVSRSDRRLGFYRNFERALRLAPASAELLALCDQDDRWHPDKLATLRASLGAAVMVYSDQRLVDATGRVLRDTMWRGRRNNHTNIASLLIANSITGAATLLRRDVADRALPFPDTPGLQFHDHWLGLVALAVGDIAYVPRPLYDYVQHAGAVFGEVSGGRAARTRAGLLRGGRGAYFLGYLPREVAAQALLARCGERLTVAKRRALLRYCASERSPIAFAWLALRPLRALARRNETLASELELVAGIAWRWAVAILSRVPVARLQRYADASFPDVLSFEQRRLRRWRARA